MDVAEPRLGVELVRLTRRCRGIDKYVSSSASLSVDEMHCLIALQTEHPASIRRLYELINVSPSRASKILKHLEQRGLVNRIADAADHRKGQVTFTEAGARIVQEILLHFTEVGSELRNTLRGDFAADLSRLLANS